MADKAARSNEPLCLFATFWASALTPKVGALASRGGLQRFTRFLCLG